MKENFDILKASFSTFFYMTLNFKLSDFCKRYNKQEQIEVQLTNGEVCVLKNQPETGNIVKEYFEKGLLTSIHSLEPNLETVFMEITGRKLV